jgi:hypothetical protein
MSFSPWHEGLVGFLEDGLLKQIESERIRVELSNLDIYGKSYDNAATFIFPSHDGVRHCTTCLGPGGSPKADLKAPASMIASLIVILPTVHEGGSIILSQKGNEWAFDSSTAVSTAAASPLAAFIATSKTE